MAELEIVRVLRDGQRLDQAGETDGIVHQVPAENGQDCEAGPPDGDDPHRGRVVDSGLHGKH